MKIFRIKKCSKCEKGSNVKKCLKCENVQKKKIVHIFKKVQIIKMFKILKCSDFKLCSYLKNRSNFRKYSISELNPRCKEIVNGPAQFSREASATVRAGAQASL
jgi:hypothetical protein